MKISRDMKLKKFFMSVFSVKHRVGHLLKVRDLSLARGLEESDRSLELLGNRVGTQSGISRIIIIVLVLITIRTANIY